MPNHVARGLVSWKRSLGLVGLVATFTGSVACSGGGTPANGSGGANSSGGSSGSGGATGSGGSGSGGSGSGGTTASGGSASGGSSSGGSASGGSSSGGSASGGSSSGGATGSGGSASGGSASGGSSSGGSSSGGSSSGGMTGGSGPAGGSNGGGGKGGTSGGGGATSCAGRALSVSANGTNSDSDAAYARVVIDLMTALPIGNAKRTVEFWAYIKSTDWVGDKNEIYYYGTSGTRTAFGMDFGTNTVTGMSSNHATLDPFTDGINDDSTLDLGITSASAQWVHIAMTWDGTSLKTYINGNLKITTTGASGANTLATGQGPLIIGCNPENKACFNGYFDEFRMWNVARTDAEIKAAYNHPSMGNETGLIGYWKFDDAPGSMTAADSVMGSGHAGMLMAAATAQLPTFVTPPTPPPLACP